MDKRYIDPFSYDDPWHPHKGNGYELNEIEFREWYGVSPWEYMNECERRGLPWVRNEGEV